MPDDRLNFDERTRTAISHAIEEAFGGETYEPTLSEPYWSGQREYLGERIRKRLNLSDGSAPHVLQTFIVSAASPEEVLAIVEEAGSVAAEALQVQGQAERLKHALEKALREGGLRCRSMRRADFREP